MAKVIIEAFIDETGPGMYKVRWFNPIKNNYQEAVYMTGFAEAKQGLMLGRRAGTAKFNRIQVTRKTKGIY